MYKTANIKTNNRRKNTTGSGKEVSIPLSRWRERERERLVVMRFFLSLLILLHLVDTAFFQVGNWKLASLPCVERWTHHVTKTRPHSPFPRSPQHDTQYLFYYGAYLQNPVPVSFHRYLLDAQICHNFPCVWGSTGEAGATMGIFESCWLMGASRTPIF